MKIRSIRMKIRTIRTGFEPFEFKFEPYQSKFEVFERDLKANSNHSNRIRYVSFCYIGWQCVRRPWLSTWRPKGWPFLGSTLCLLLTSSISSPKETSLLRYVTVSHLRTSGIYTKLYHWYCMYSTCYSTWPRVHAHALVSFHGLLTAQFLILYAFKASKPCY